MAKVKLLRTLGPTMAVALLGTGCLVKEDLATWYLEPGGSVTWSAMEKDVHSDAENANDQQIEEANYVEAVRLLNHPMARGFAELGARDVRTRILRGSAPFTVVTEARFPSIAFLGDQIIQRTGLAGTSTISHDETGSTWTFSVRDPHAPNGVEKPDDDLSALTVGLDRLAVVLTDGRFVQAKGFQLSGDGRTATMIKWDEDALKDDGVLLLKLTWR
jgi:hypothetical protein